MTSINSAVRLGAATVDEGRCITELEELQTAVTEWAKRHELWRDAGFHTPFIHRSDAPERYCALLLTFEGPLYDLFNYSLEDSDNLYEEFSTLLKSRGFEFELENHYTMEIMPTDERRADEYLALYRWQWIQHLATKRLFDIHSEVFDHFPNTRSIWHA